VVEVRSVFISSASGALAPYRHTAVDVCHRLGLLPVYMEDFDPQRPPPIEVCKSKVDSSDVFVLLLAHRYGSRPPGHDLSFTELEYEWALARPNMDILPFRVDSDFPWPAEDADDPQAARTFADRVGQRHVVRRFGELAKFREDLLIVLGRLPAPDPASGFDPASAGAASAGAAVEVRAPRPPQLYAEPPYVGSAPFVGRLADLALLDAWAGSADPVMVVEAIGGTGKSALTWQWTTGHAPKVIDGLAGTLWWSFYEGSASVTRFLQATLAYLTGRPSEQIRPLPRPDLADQVLLALRSRPYLLVLDGFERLLGAYHRFDPSKLPDEAVDLGQRSMIDPEAEIFLRGLTTAAPSRILISTRLRPSALDGRFGARLAGTRQVLLPGLTDDDVAVLLDRLGVRGSPAAIAGFFRPLGNHPLLLGVVAGLVRDYRPDPGSLDAWAADPAAGGSLGLAGLNLAQRRTHILSAALDGLPARSRRILDWISVLVGSVDWDTLDAINPFRPPRPEPVVPDLRKIGTMPPYVDPAQTELPSMVVQSGWPGLGPTTPRLSRDQRLWKRYQARVETGYELARRETEARVAQWRASEPVVKADALLDDALKDLEERGLVWWDRSSNTYDLHPVIRSYTHDLINEGEAARANMALRDHFQALPPEDLNAVTTVEDLRRSITIFRALIGAKLPERASDMWDRDLGEAVLFQLGAYGTTVELLRPLLPTGSPYVRSTLSIAYHELQRYDEAIEVNARLLAEDLHHPAISADGRESNVDRSLARIGSATLGPGWSPDGRGASNCGPSCPGPMWRTTPS
jgi:hypothetical protein